jgi:hypothetical protein
LGSTSKVANVGSEPVEDGSRARGRGRAEGEAERERLVVREEKIRFEFSVVVARDCAA